MGQVVQISLRTSATAADRRAAIERWLHETPAGSRAQPRVVLAEGLLFDQAGPQGVPVIGLGAGCPCCVGLLPLRVRLARVLRQRQPAAVLLLLAQDQHLPRLHRLLAGGELGVRFEVEPC